MNETAEVYLWGTRIGIIHQPRGRKYASFEYDRNFLNSGIEVSPLKMPLASNVYEFPDLADGAFHGLPGLVADSLPDKFGNAVIEKWLLSQGKSISDFTAIDRLCYTGKRGMGALEYVPETADIEDIDENINVQEMVRFASEVLNDQKKITLNAKNELAYSQLVQVGSSAGGARAKALIAWNERTNEVKSGQLQLGEGFDYWLMKFDNVSKNGDHGLEDRPEYTLIEYAYHKMSVACGIQMNECKLYHSGNDNHFMTKRFDRADGKKIHMQSLGALVHISYQEPALCSYELAARYMKEIGLVPKEIEQFYRRMTFNCLAANQDDHVKNVSFLMDRTGRWPLAPAYDITFAYDKDNKWLRGHQMTVNGKTTDIAATDIAATDIVAAGTAMGLKERRCKDIAEECTEVIAHFPDFAKETGIRKETVDYINSIIN
ncbi:MAG: type II toxin-antitoxin system HipA family toxin [Treponema sp.]|nr:type II toxin-antitoxin system HipA family toxin [Treponema sp.]